jgi:signal transduction histidine kinase
MVAVYSVIEFIDYSKEEELLREKFYNDQKLKVARETEKIAEYINLSRLFLEDKLNRQLYERTNEAWSTMENLYNKYKNSKSKQEIKNIIKEALRPVRFNNGRGYYFVVSLNGVEELFPVSPEYEGKNLLELTDDMGNLVIQDELEIVNKFGEGFVTDYWKKPGDNSGMIYPKTSYIKLFKPLDWYVGCGEYLDEVQKDIQGEAKKAIKRMRFDYNGYAFAYTFKGDPIVTNNQKIPETRNLWDTVDAQGVKIIQKMRELVDNIEGGYLIYQWSKPDSDSIASKITYCRGIHDWEWIVGAGVYLDEIEKVIENDKKHLYQQLYKKIFIAVLFSLLLLVLVSILIKRIARNLQTNFANFSQSLEHAVSTSSELPYTNIQIEDIKIIIKEINVVVRNKKETEEQLRMSESLFRVIFDHVPVMLLIFDSNLNPTRWNIEAEKYFVISPEDRHYNSLSKIQKSANIGALQMSIFRENEEHDGIFRTFPVETKEGLRYQNWATFKTDLDAIVTVGYDISEIKNQEEELRNLNKAKDKIFSIISHDLHGPFNAIIGFAQIYLAKHDKLSDEKKIAYVSQINSSATNMHKQLLNLLQWARMQTGNVKVSIGKVNLSAMAEDIFAVLQPQAQLKQIELKNTIDAAIRINADSSMLGTVLQNLISNSIKFTNNKGLIEISAISLSQYTTITITDNGIGMNKSQLDNLFDLTQTPRRKGTANEMGTGLGLVICKEFVEKMSGRLWVESSENAGTTMYIQMPTA